MLYNSYAYSQERVSSATEQESSGILLDDNGILAASNVELDRLVRNAGFSSGDRVSVGDIQCYLNANPGVRLGTVNGGHRRDAKLMLRDQEPSLFNANEALRNTSFHLYVGLSAVQARYMSKVVNEATRTTVSDSLVAMLTVR